jgi:hypothetical protein
MRRMFLLTSAFFLALWGAFGQPFAIHKYTQKLVFGFAGHPHLWNRLHHPTYSSWAATAYPKDETSFGGPAPLRCSKSAAPALPNSQLLNAFVYMGVSKEQKIQQIDAEIAELEQIKRGYEAKALRHESQAQYLQFENRAWLEARRHQEMAEENRAKAAYIQEKIDTLENEKQRLEKPWGRK